MIDVSMTNSLIPFAGWSVMRCAANTDLNNLQGVFH